MSAFPEMWPSCFDTYGFPIDLTREIAARAGHVVNEAQFDAAMAEQSSARVRMPIAMRGQHSQCGWRFPIALTKRSLTVMTTMSWKAAGLSLGKDGQEVDCAAVGDEVR